ncbi:MAG: hypothetical protein HYZ57_05530 [Acidobacteria bacterium]|nr:hypothetical protein [Acidobacteriota bacterium]
MKIQIDTDLNNDWAFFGLALINEVTGEVFDTGKEISFYRDSEGSEGSTSGSVLISEVPAGRYYLRVEPDMQESISSVFSQARPSRSVNYRLAVYRDPPAHAFYWAALILMLVPPLWVTYRAFVFENRRWAESDYGALIQSSSEDD